MRCKGGGGLFCRTSHGLCRDYYYYDVDDDGNDDDDVY